MGVDGIFHVWVVFREVLYGFFCEFRMICF